MGLAVEVGLLADQILEDEEGADWFREYLGQINEILAENHLSAHVEPETLPVLNSRAAIESYPYSFLHHLRRFAAYASTKPSWKPTPFVESDDPADDPVVAAVSALQSSHLICHSDCEGLYVPIDYAKPLLMDEERVPGGPLGSSQGLMRELISVAPFLGVGLSGGQLSDAEATRINDLAEAEGSFWVEHVVWISLFEAARLSLEHKSAICFS